MKLNPTLIALAASCGFVFADDDGRDLRLADCPEPVRTTIESNARGGHVDEVEHIAIGDREIYIADVELARDISLTIHVLGNGTLVKTREDVPRDAQPAFAASLASDRGGRLDDVEKEIANGKVTYHIEIDRPGQPDLDLVVAEDGKVISEQEEHDD